MPILPHQKSRSGTVVQFLPPAFEVHIGAIEKGFEKHGIEDVKERISCAKQI
jgi:hypothetical protein